MGKFAISNLLLCILVACKSGEQAKPSPAKAAPSAYTAARQAELYFSTEVKGYVEPCGCTTDPLGGLGRLAQIINQSKLPHGLVDAGNLLLPTEGLNEVTRGQHLAKAHLLAKAYRKLGVVGLNVGPGDLAEGAEFLLTLQKEGSVPLVSANVAFGGKQGPEIARSYLRTIGSIRFAIIGIATPETIAQASPKFTALEYASALTREIAVRKKEGAEIVVVLAHITPAEAKSLAKAVPQIDLLIRAPGTPIDHPPKAPISVGPVVIAEAGSQGQHIGRIRVAFDKDTPARPFLLDDAGAKALRRKQRTQQKIKAWQMEVDAWSVDPKKKEAVKARTAQIAQLKARLAQPEPKPEPMNKPHIRVELLRLDGSVSDDASMGTLMAAYYQQLKKMNLEKGNLAACKPKNKKDPVYVGTEKCASCHEEAYDFWKKTKHAKAWETLEKDNKHYDLTCIGCHTVGYEKPGGFCRIKDVGVLKDVGCENCHGPGSAHVEDSDPSSIQLEVTEQTCAGGCHVPEHSDSFVYEKYLRQITGPGHELSED